MYTKATSVEKTNIKYAIKNYYLGEGGIYE